MVSYDVLHHRTCYAYNASECSQHVGCCRWPQSIAQRSTHATVEAAGRHAWCQLGWRFFFFFWIRGSTDLRRFERILGGSGSIRVSVDSFYPKLQCCRRLHNRKTCRSVTRPLNLAWSWSAASRAFRLRRPRLQWGWPLSITNEASVAMEPANHSDKPRSLRLLFIFGQQHDKGDWSRAGYVHGGVARAKPRKTKKSQPSQRGFPWKSRRF